MLLAEQKDLIVTLPSKAARLQQHNPRLVLRDPPFEIPPIDLKMAWSPLLQNNPGTSMDAAFDRCSRPSAEIGNQAMAFKTSDQGTLLPSLAVSVGAAIWGIYWLPLRYVDQLGLSGAWAVVLASLIPLFILIPLSVWYRQQIIPDIKIALAIGLFTGGALAFYSTGLIYTTVVRATLLFYLTPVWSTIFGIIWLHETVRWNRWVAIIVGLAGLYFIVGGAASDSRPINIGDWFGIASGLCWGIGAVLIKKHPEVNIVGQVTSQHGFSFLIALTCCLLLPGIVDLPALAAWIESMPVMLLYSWLGLLPSMLALFWASSRLFPGRVGI